MELTQDPYVIIIHRGEQHLIYYNVETDEQWLVYGNCTLKGYCIEGAVNPDLRPYVERLDIPVRPDFRGCCDLRGEYL